MPLAPAPPLPYDSLATVTALVRVALGDFIQNIQPFNQGTVNTDPTGKIVTWVSGSLFNALFNGVRILINNQPLSVAMVTGPNSLILNETGPQSLANATYSLVIPTGDIFADTQAYVIPTVNLAWRKVQKNLANQGHPRMETEADILSLPVVANLDPISQQWINWSNFYDGVNLLTPSSTPAGPTLPQDWISPLRLWERQSVSGATPTNPNLNTLQPMSPASDGLIPRPKGSRNRYWDWRNDKLYFRGSIVPMDLHARYAAYLPDFVYAGLTFDAIPVPIMSCADALAYYTSAIFVTPRGSALGPDFDAKGDLAMSQITNSDAKLKQRASYSRIPWGGRRRNRLRF